MFLLKKIITPLLLLMPLCLGCLITGLLLLWFTRKQKTGKILVSIGAILLTIFSFGPVSNVFLRTLEHQYPPFITPSETLTHDDAAPAVKWIVVLGGGHTSDPRLPSSSQLTAASLIRLIEAIRLHRKLPGSKLVLSEGRVFDSTAGAEVMAKAAQDLGVDQQNIILEADSKDTEDEARFIQPIVGKDKFLLVTSASHMPRSMALFTKFEMNPIPAPTDYITKKSQSIYPGNFFPSAVGLRKAEIVLYEYLGLAWARVRGKA